MVEPEETPFVIRYIPTYNFFKRAFDIFNSLLALIVLSPLMLLTALIVKITSPGPIIYVSQRVGMRGKVFNFYKFRSMYKDADARLEPLLSRNEVPGGVTFKMKDDPRVTPFGRFIRRTSIDELPQLVNILKGDMSIVGPRPCTVREYQLYNETDKLRLSVPQGLTGEWQTGGRSHTSFDDMINKDLTYIEEKRGFFYDIWLIMKTIGVLFRHDNGAE